MASRDDIERVAQAMHAVRLDWPVRSLVTYLADHHGQHPYRALLVAGVVVASDARTQTPKLLEQHGAWWIAAQAAMGGDYTDRLEPRCDKPGHGSYIARNCGACRSEELATDTPQATPSADPAQVAVNAAGRERVQQAIDEARRTA